MHRHWTRRLATVLFGLWFCLAGFDTGADDACAMQGMAQASQAPGAGQHAAASHALATDATHSMPMGQDSDHGSDSGHQHRCPCCSCCSVSILDAPPQMGYFAAAYTPPTAPVASQSGAPKAWVDFILPFPTAPPTGLQA